ncbi:SGNH/GDSL hydrolase family protein [Pseudoruegeria sp. SK021]|uniref:SGNH/GDSL hydrolase family protein n=1 Tax=Pseudoruegeria sp. SK021 TaxID=1933035 RepID=UPI000A2589D5|nr:SGNH/GDSL hydrolase family protein [Pseudoruegeria sp. SK021]OSP54072.1 hypothetical protein BV911_14375 [Pseudoruegeria sp. SK021]
MRNIPPKYIFGATERLRLWRDPDRNAALKRLVIFLLALLAFCVAIFEIWVAMARPSAPRDRVIAPVSLSGSPVRLVAFGSSLTWSNPWPDELAWELSSCLGLPVEVVRVARNGAGSSWGMEAVDQVLAAKPDLVLMEFAINDADVLDGVSLHRSRTQHAALIERLTTTVPSGHVVLMTMNPVGGIHLVLRPFLPRYYALQVGLADSHDTALADLYADWLALPMSQRRFADGLHPAPEDTARVVVPGLVRRIAEAAGRDCPPNPELTGRPRPDTR